MELQLVNVEQAKALKELGFPTKWTYNKNVPNTFQLGDRIHGFAYHYYPALELVAKWLRDEKRIIVTVKPFFVHSNVHSKEIEVIKYIVNVEGITDGNTYFVQFTSAPINSYEEALSAGIDKAIEILKGI